MSSNEPLPPWMRADESARPNPTPPASGPPPLRPRPADGDEAYAYRTPRSTGTLTFVAIMNLVFALGCGFLGGFGYVMPLVVLTAEAPPEHLRVEWERSIDQALEQQFRHGGAGNGLSEEQQKRFTKALSASMFSTMEIVRQSAATASLRQAAVGGAAAHGAIFFGAVLLLMRKRAGWWISAIGLAGFIACCAVSIPTFESVVAEASVAVGESLRDPARVPELTDAERNQFAELTAQLPAGASAAAAAGGIAAALWPILSLLILLSSRSLREALTPDDGVEVFR
jgi:uncharacterized membrane protein